MYIKPKVSVSFLIIHGSDHKQAPVKTNKQTRSVKLAQENENSEITGH